MKDLETKSNITDVTVYNDRALITRVSENTLEIGEYNILFKIPFNIDEDSLRASGTGPASLKITGSGTKIIEHMTAPDISFSELEEKIQLLQDQQKEIQSRITLHEQKKEFLHNTAKQCEIALPQAAKNGNFDIGNLSSAADYIFPLMESLGEEIRNLQKNLRSLDKEIDYNNRLIEKHRRPLMTKEKAVFVSLDIKTAGEYKIKINYVIHGASWNPVYDVRVDFKSGKVELSCLGMVSQNTGEDWQDVQLQLSTARPGMSAQPPHMQPLYVDFLKAARTEIPLQASMAPRRPKPAESDPFDMDISEDQETSLMSLSASMEMDNHFAAEVETAESQTGGTSVTYTILRRTDIPSDGDAHRQTISINDFDGEFDYITVPRIDARAFLRTKIKNVSSNIFLSGNMKIFFDNDFIGTGYLNTVAPNEVFELFLGSDESVKIERKLEEVDIGKSGLLKGNRKRTYEYKIEVQNLKNSRETITVIDQVPVSRQADIRVEFVKIKPEPYRRQKNNILFWKDTLEPEEKWEITVRYSVEHPAGTSITGI